MTEKNPQNFSGFTRLFSLLFILLFFCLLNENFDERNDLYKHFLKFCKDDLKNFLTFLILIFFKIVIFFKTQFFLTFISFEGIIFYYCYEQMENHTMRSILGLFNLINTLKLLGLYWDNLNQNIEFIFFAKNFYPVNKNKKTKLSFLAYLRFLMLPSLIFKESFLVTKFDFLKTIQSFFLLVLSALCFIFLKLFFYLPILEKIKMDEFPSNIVEVVKFSIFSIVTWLSFFVFFFVCLFNFLGEVFLFRRKNYKNFWNCSDNREFWRLWNFQVHDYIRLHLLKRLKCLGIFRNFSIFLISAVLHEYLSFLVFKKIYGVVFAGMMGQLVVFYLEEKKIITQSNMSFWVICCLFGQPLSAILLEHCVKKY